MKLVRDLGGEERVSGRNERFGGRKDTHETQHDGRFANSGLAWKIGSQKSEHARGEFVAKEPNLDDVPRRTSLTWTDLSGPEALSAIVLRAREERERVGGRDEDAATCVVTV